MATAPTVQARRIPIRLRPAGILAAAVLVAVASAVTGWTGLGSHESTPPGAVRPPLNRAPAGAGNAAPAPVEIPGAGALPPSGSLAIIDHNIGLTTKTLQANPQDFISATNLAILYHARARFTADLADHQRALDAARLAMKIAPGQTQAAALEAAILFPA